VSRREKAREREREERGGGLHTQMMVDAAKHDHLRRAKCLARCSFLIPYFIFCFPAASGAGASGARSLRWVPRQPPSPAQPRRCPPSRRRKRRCLHRRYQRLPRRPSPRPLSRGSAARWPRRHTQCCAGCSFRAATTRVPTPPPLPLTRQWATTRPPAARVPTAPRSRRCRWRCRRRPLVTAGTTASMAARRTDERAAATPCHARSAALVRCRSALAATLSEHTRTSNLRFCV
jgi:hypothetical protein